MPNGKFFLFSKDFQAYRQSKNLAQNLNTDQGTVQRMRELFDEHFSVLDISGKAKDEMIKREFPGVHFATRRSELARPVKSKFEGVLDFRVGNIKQMHEFLPSGQTGIMLGHNFLYHETGAMRFGIHKASMQPAKEIFREVHIALSDNGIYSLGKLSYDHLQDESNHGLEVVEQNGQKIKVFHNSLVHKEMRNAGLEPIFYSKGSHYGSYVPTVWKKV